MNLKEAFRYQGVLDGWMNAASHSIQNREHCLIVTRTHHCNKVNSEAEDFAETVETEEFFQNDDVIRFMGFLLLEKEKLTTEIGKAKASIDFDIDAATATNKFRQEINSAIKMMMRFQPSKRVEAGYGYKFNVEGNQVQYRYDVDVESKAAYNKDLSKDVMRSAIADADKTSAEIDAAKINTVVNYTPVFDVNESFEDVMTTFMSMEQPATA